MRLLFWSILGITILALSGCIPSIHGIVIPGEELEDDRILGTWILTDSDSEADPSVTSDPDDLESNYDQELEKEEMIWNFERAASLTFSNPGSTHTSEMPVGAASLCPPGMEINEVKLLPYYFLTHTDRTGGDFITTHLLVYLTQINDNQFMDFQPYPIQENALLGRFSTNFVQAHTFARFSITDQGISIQSLNGDFIEDLIRKRRIRLKHEITASDEIVLTASTEELRAFLEKYANDPALYDLNETLVPIYQ